MARMDKITVPVEITIDLATASRRKTKYSFEAFLLVAQEEEFNPYLGPQKPTDGDKKKKKKKETQ